MPAGGGFFPGEENDEVRSGSSRRDEEHAAADHYCGLNETTIDDSNSYQPSTSHQEYRIISSPFHLSFDDDCSSVLSEEEHHHHKVKVLPQHAPHHRNGSIEIEEGHCMTFPEKV